jgi:hypothetical protein
VIKKDIHTKEKHNFSSLWERSFIVVDIAALGAYVLAVTPHVIKIPIKSLKLQLRHQASANQVVEV